MHEDEQDDLRGCRGMLLGMVLGSIMWVGIIQFIRWLW